MSCGRRPKGIDVGLRYRDIRRIVLKHFSVAGVHPDDLVQDVVLRLLEQNLLPCTYDPERGALSTYVYRVAQNRAARLARIETMLVRTRAALRDELRPRAGQRQRVCSDTRGSEPFLAPLYTWAQLAALAPARRRPRRARPPARVSNGQEQGTTSPTSSSASSSSTGDRRHPGDAHDRSTTKARRQRGTSTRRRKTSRKQSTPRGEGRGVGSPGTELEFAL